MNILNTLQIAHTMLGVANFDETIQSYVEDVDAVIAE